MNRRAFLALAALVAASPGAALAAGGGGKKMGGGATYIQLPTTNATVVRPDGRRGVMSVGTGVDAPDPKVHALAQASIPRLRAAYAQSLQIYAGGLPPNRPPDTEYLAKMLQRDTDQVLGRTGAKLLLGAVMIN